jgi:hypothetical protein
MALLITSLIAVHANKGSFGVVNGSTQSTTLNVTTYSKNVFGELLFTLF